jgi:acyl-CoA synthetase (AMP-forming)/AMP-acid ligase II/1-acyl-sn-glycerol-3-phosphate acyltransferase
MSLLSRFVTFCLNRRYEVSVEGEELIKKYKDTSILFLANHPATIDPVIVLTFLYPYVKLQPMAASKFFKSSFTHFFLKKIKALPVPEFEDGTNEYKAFLVEKLTQKMKEALKAKAKILLYPAGKISDTSFEKIGGATLAFDVKDSARKVIGIATDGLYGSIFSKYFEGKTPPFTAMLLKGIKIALCNGIFFLPKRKVTIRLFEVEDEIKNLQDKFLFNQSLEKKFNSYTQHKDCLVPYGFCKTPKRHQIKKDLEERQVDPKILDELLIIIEKVTKKKISSQAHFSYDVGIDSLELAEILAMVEQKYHVRIDSMPQTPIELGFLLAQKAQAPVHQLGKLSKRKALKIALPESENLLEAFYKQATRQLGCRMGVDLSVGEMTYQKACLAIELLSTKIKKMQGEYIGILLPSSLMAYVLMFSILKAGKKPVMLNWTSGRKSLDFACDLLKIEHILSSEKFLEKAFNVDLGTNFEKLKVLEDLKKDITLFSKLKAFLKVFIPQKKSYERIKKSDIACVLFTSGSEAIPKAVPLTHENILSNITSLLKTNLVKDDDRFLATLPPFHSFGCVVSGFLPIVCGLDTVYLPDPTDAINIASCFKQFKATLFCSAPSFMKQILIYAEKGQLDSLRLSVVGAEKLQESTKILFKDMCPQATLLEGYGITECSPVVTIQKKVSSLGVGTPLDGIELLIVDPDSLTPLPKGHVGEILVCGKNVFNGYLGLKKDPFVEIDFKKWYRTGDRGSLSPKNELILEGRYKRFIKISAEMISLGSLEEALEDFRSSVDDVAQFAVITDQHKEKLILVTIHEKIDLDDVNNHIRLKGLPKVAKFSQIVKVKAIPQLATGKVDYRKLENEIV